MDTRRLIFTSLGSKNVFENKVWSVLDGAKKIINIDYCPAFENLYPRGSKIPCICIYQKGYPVYKPDWKAIYSGLYSVDKTYPFNAIKVSEDPKSLTKKLFLEDSYGFTFVIEKPSQKAITSIGKVINCKVVSIDDTGVSLKIEGQSNQQHKASKQEELYFDKLHRLREELFNTLNRRATRGIWNGIINKYPDSVHFIYELLQNADDAEATEASFILTTQYLIFKHNGAIQFSITDDDDDSSVGHINSITAIADSTKTEEMSQNKIGKFGLGFKSVFQYSDAPEIYDDKFSFRIINIVIPERIGNDHPFRDEGETLFYIPFKDPKVAYDEIDKKLKTLANGTLFLNNLQRIRWKNLKTKEEREYTKDVVDSYASKKSNILLEKIQIADYLSSVVILMFSRTIDLKEHGKHRIFIGYYLDHDGRINTEIRPPVYCFFPTTETFDTCMVAHAPFLLVDNRQNIMPNQEVNDLLISELGKLAADSLVELRDYGIRCGNLFLNDNIYEILQFDNYPYKSAYRWYMDTRTITRDKLLDVCLEKVKTKELILSADNKYRNPRLTYKVSPVRLAEILSPQQLGILQSKDGVGILADELNTQYWDDDLVEAIGLKEYDPSVLASDITEEFMAAQSMQWVSRFFGFIVNDARSLWLPEEKNHVFLTAPIIKNTEGNWIPPFNDVGINVFKSGDSSEYNVVAPEMLQHRSISRFLDEIGCKEPDQLDYINTHIFTKYENKVVLPDNELKEDFDYIFRYYYDSASLESRRQLVEKAKATLKLACKDRKGLPQKCSPTDVLIDSQELKDYFAGSGCDVKYIDRKFYSKTIEAYGADAVLDFLYELGISSLPSIIITRSSYSSALTDTQKVQLDYYKTQKTYWKIEEPELEGLANALEHINKNRSFALWSILCRINLQVLSRSKFTYQYYQYYTKSCESKALELLKTTEWIWIDDRFVIPSASTQDSIKAAGYQPNSELYDLLGIRQAEISLKELGASEEQQKTFELGEIAKRNGYSVETLELLIERDKERKKEEKKKQKAEEVEKSIVLLTTREALTAGGKEVFADGLKLEQTIQSEVTVPGDKRTEERKEKFKQDREKVLADIDTTEKYEELRERVALLPRYTKEWFDGLLELEYRGDDRQRTEAGNQKSVSLSFGKVVKDPVNDRIYILKQPSGRVPLSLEELDKIEVRFQFTDKEDISVSFEVGSVRDFTLRLKAKAKDESTLSKIDWKNTCTRAIVSTNNVTELMGKLISAFNDLDVPPEFDFKANLKSNVSFVFGPPGTGKTTFIAEKICSIMDEEQNCKILVLAPTNQACDVVTERIAKTRKGIDWLGRFVATGSDWIEKNDLLILRESEIYEQDQCCVVSTMARLPYDGFADTGRRMALRDVDWNYIVIDEASMIPLAQVVYAIYQFSPYAKIIIAGDPMQIPPIVREKLWEKENIYTMVELNRFDNPTTKPIQFEITNLTTQYRSVPAIGKVFSEYRYNGLLKHYRSQNDQRKIIIKGFPFKSVNFVQFKVERYDSIFGPKKLSDSNVQVYSVLFITELSKYIAKVYSDKKPLRIGIICPYRAEAQMIERLVEQLKNVPDNIHFDVGTIHGFQGDECDMVFVVFNPPTGLKTHPNSIMLNEKHIINVAISRARDYLFLLIPHHKTDGFGNLTEIRRLGNTIYEQVPNEIGNFSSDDIEEIIFGEKFYLENHSFITTHQMANVYTDPQAKYEVRIDENAVDIQVSE